MISKLVPIGVLAVAAAFAVAPFALADGDPASDTLIYRNVFLPYPAPAKDASTELERQVAGAYSHGYRLKVAVIANTRDLGAIPSLFNKPQDYAKFLGFELQSYYVGPLLIVMPAGFGIWDGGRSTSAEHKVLSGMSVSGSSADDLASTGARVVGKLIAARALKSKDITRPYASALGTTGLRGASLTLKYAAFDDSGKAAVTIRVLVASKVAATFKRPLGPVRADRAYSVTWRVPARLKGKTGQMCIRAVDPSGNRSQKSCSPLPIR